MSRLEKVGSVREALIIQAAMFSVLHMFPAIFISHFIIGIILGAVRLRSGSLYPGMLIHAVWNGIAIAGEAYHLSSITC
jgi:membrane protease YdiL (CAAX protease family)